MKVYTYVRIDIETGEQLEEESFEYSGPVAQCVSGGGGTRTQAGPSALDYHRWNYIQSRYGIPLAAMMGDVFQGAPMTNLPFFANAMQQSRQAASRAESATSDQLALKNLLGTPFGESIMSQARMQGAGQTMMAPYNLFETLLAPATQVATGMPANPVGEKKASQWSVAPNISFGF